MFIAAAPLALTACGSQTAATGPSTVVAYAVPFIVQSPVDKVDWQFVLCNTGDDERTLNLSVRWAAGSASGLETPIIAANDHAPKQTLSSGQCRTATTSWTNPTAIPLGWHVLEILDGTHPIGELGVARRPIAAKKLALSLPAPPALVSIKGQAAHIIVTNNGNEPGASTPVGWSLDAGPWHSAGAAELNTGSSELLIPVRGQERWTQRFWRIWPASRQGRLTFTLGHDHTPDGPVLSQVLPVTIRLYAFDEATQSVLKTILVLVPLLIGGGLAYFLNTVVPLERRRTKARDALLCLIDEVKELKTITTPYEDIRNMIACDVKQLDENLEAYRIGSPELNENLPTLESAIEILRLKVAALNRISSLRRGLPAPAGRGLSLLGVEMARNLCSDVADSLRATGVGRDALIAWLQKLDTAESIANAAGQEHHLVRDAIATRCQELTTQVAQLVTAQDTRWTDLCGALNRPHASAIRAIQFGTVHPGDQQSRELQMWLVQLSLDFHATDRAVNGDELAPLNDAFRNPTWTTVAAARQALRAADVTELEIESAARSDAPPCAIVACQQPVRAHELLALSAWFDDDRFNYSTVREQWQCRWEFDGKEIEETGWTIWRYFPLSSGRRGSDPEVKLLGFKRPEAEELKIKTPPSLKIKVLDPRRTRLTQPWLTTVGTLLLVQLVTLFGLLSRDVTVIENRDPLAAILILIATGFGADTIRSIVSAAATKVGTVVASSQSAPAAAPPPQGAPVPAAPSTAAAPPTTTIPAGSSLARRLGL